MMAVAERELIAPAQEAEEEFTPEPYRWTREQFYQMGDMGLFEGRRAILVEGEILAMPAMNPPHQGVTTIASDLLRTVFGQGFVVREQAPFDVGAATDPEPDIAVVRGQMRDFLLAHPTEAALIVEVSSSTLLYDRREKASLYAKAGIAEYWIINIEQEPAQVEVHRQPGADETQPYGFGYAEKTMHQRGEILQPLASPKPVAVSALLP